ncbi:MAG: hypothetical protein HN856_15245 [Gammaproteobacteria bacterium]|nr:hypothetical protein [Gammaproteobacteria bacterium]
MQYQNKPGIFKRIAAVAAAALATALIPLNLQANEIIEIIQDAPELVQIDLGNGGHSHGDISAFEAAFRTKEGNKGVIEGFITTVDAASLEGGEVHHRLVDIVIDFGATDTLVVGGRSRYRAQAFELTAEDPQTRAVVGGTGRFMGARGQITTIRMATGKYSHLIELVD